MGSDMFSKKKEEMAAPREAETSKLRLSTSTKIHGPNTLTVLIMNFYFLYSDALTSGALLTVEGLPFPWLGNSWK